jgi:hypothetical protein
MSAFLTIVIETESNSVLQLNQFQSGATLPKQEFNQLIDYLSKCMGGNEVVQAFYVVTNNSDPAVATDGGSSTKIVYTPSL